MALNVLTQDDLENFKMELFQELKTIIVPELRKEISNPKGEKYFEHEGKRWLKSYQVMRMLGISTGTLQNLRINRKIPWTKFGGCIYYPFDGIMKQFSENLTDAE